MLGVLATLLSAVTVTVLPANAACPRADSVAADLDRLGASAALAALGSPEITVEAGHMRVVLRGHDGSILGSREIAAPEACDERASVAAVFVAAWVGAWSTRPMPNLPHPMPTTAAAASRGFQARETTVQSTDKSMSRVKSQSALPLAVSKQPPAPSPPPTPSLPSAVSPPIARPQPVRPVRPAETSMTTGRSDMVEIAALAFGTHDGDAGTFGAGVSAAYQLGTRLALAALLETTGERDAVVGPVIATYRTYRLGVGASVRHRWGRLFGDASILPELTMLNAKGRPLVSSRSVTTWGAAVEVRGRLGLAFGRFVPFLFAGGSGALRAESLTLDDVQATTALSRWNLSVGAGLAVFFGGKD